MASADAGMTPGLLLDEVDRLLRTVVKGTRGLWPRTAAFLIRLALEHAVADFWARRVPQMRACSMRAQLVCLREYVEGDLAERVHAVWAGLSRACHFHSYELGPTAAELRAWHTEVRDVSHILVAPDGHPTGVE